MTVRTSGEPSGVVHELLQVLRGGTELIKSRYMILPQEDVTKVPENWNLNVMRHLVDICHATGSLIKRRLELKVSGIFKMLCVMELSRGWTLHSSLEWRSRQ